MLGELAVWMLGGYGAGIVWYFVARLGRTNLSQRYKEAGGCKEGLTGLQWSYPGLFGILFNSIGVCASILRGQDPSGRLVLLACSTAILLGSYTVKRIEEKYERPDPTSE